MVGFRSLFQRPHRRGEDLELCEERGADKKRLRAGNTAPGRIAINFQFTNFQFSINFQHQMNKFSKDDRTYDLEERTAKFAEEIINFLRTIQETAINRRIISQLVGSAGSFGANYCEANEAESKRDFIHKIGICKKEIKETQHWLRLLTSSNPELQDEMRIFWQEAHELLLIFAKIKRSSQGQ